MELLIPSHALVVLIGPAGCGKSTFAKRHFSPTQVVSSDECRALVSDDPDNNRASADAFALMDFIIDKRLKRGRLTVADATNVRTEKRERLLILSERHRRPAIAVVFDLPEKVCQSQNRLREGRKVPFAAVSAHVKALHASLQGLSTEGFSAIHVLRSIAEVNDVGITLTEPV